MNNKASNWITENPSRTVFLIGLILNILLWVFVLLTFPKDSPAAVLHYTAGIWVDFIGEGLQIIVLPSIGTLLLVMNVVLARSVQGVSGQAGTSVFWVLWGSVPFFQILLLATYQLIRTLNA